MLPKGIEKSISVLNTVSILCFILCRYEINFLKILQKIMQWPNEKSKHFSIWCIQYELTIKCQSHILFGNNKNYNKFNN